ncbi:DUF4886 domain-containing protein [Bradymonas sediminis]|uniref:SGNH/GDSL hydrolase family protein n=1 Tax=Bradymonas sediminis TaxID=1548548 RepID=A0A2Z4FLQ4_9DELT|nr:DUF4886 domain-containing protein [Bradymonas sediminis]AWV89760.1 hypothetical protein DN745_10585 [Bradymonas sediminis]TDP76493.1 hypothetical protein DFR33_102124 [Bradymonas sediminis]
MKKLTPIRVAILITALLALGTFVAYSAGYRLNAPAPPERIYDAPPPQALRVLFIGNSHTYVHDVPGMVQRLGEANGTPIWVEALTIGGASLSDHLRRPGTNATIQGDGWDFVVLQEHSLTPALNPEQFYQSLDLLASTATEAGATPVIYATWARHGDDPYFQRQTRFTSPMRLQEALDRAFATGAQRSNALVSPVGTAWHHYYGQNTAKRLHAPDGNHANLAGAYLAACVFYRVLQDAPCTGNTYRPGRISAASALRLQQVADRSPKQWSVYTRSQRF